MDEIRDGNLLRVINSRAPIRVCDIGGWTDTWFAQHGKVLNMAVSPRVEVQIEVFARDSRDQHADGHESDGFKESRSIHAFYFPSCVSVLITKSRSP